MAPTDKRHKRRVLIRRPGSPTIPTLIKSSRPDRGPALSHAVAGRRCQRGSFITDYYIAPFMEQGRRRLGPWADQLLDRRQPSARSQVANDRHHGPTSGRADLDGGAGGAEVVEERRRFAASARTRTSPSEPYHHQSSQSRHHSLRRLRRSHPRPSGTIVISPPLPPNVSTWVSAPRDSPTPIHTG